MVDAVFVTTAQALGTVDCLCMAAGDDDDDVDDDDDDDDNDDDDHGASDKMLRAILL